MDFIRHGGQRSSRHALGLVTEVRGMLACELLQYIKQSTYKKVLTSLRGCYRRWTGSAQALPCGKFWNRTAQDGALAQIVPRPAHTPLSCTMPRAVHYTLIKSHPMNCLKAHAASTKVKASLAW